VKRPLIQAVPVLIAAVLCLVLACGVILVLLRGRTPALGGPASITSLETVKLGGTKQWILVRGRDASKPVVLFLHGGPGMPSMYLAHVFQAGLEQDFVVVHWDRRGAGKSYEAGIGGEPLTVSGTLEDTWELTELLRERFHQERIYLVGHSWGSYLGLLAVRGRPDLYRAFVGTGQMAGSEEQVRKKRREYFARRARETGDAELAARLESPDFRATEEDLFEHNAELYGATSVWPLLRAGLFAPEYTLRDVLNVKRGAERLAREMQNDVSPKPLEGEIERFEVPIFFFLGRYDYNTPSALATDYLERLEAPLKEVVWFEHAAHFPFLAEPERFHEEMARVKVLVEG
jgi:pimeloyl-ACP methyl ester carboxylesterase